MFCSTQGRRAGGALFLVLAGGGDGASSTGGGFCHYEVVAVCVGTVVPAAPGGFVSTVVGTGGCPGDVAPVSTEWGFCAGIWRLFAQNGSRSAGAWVCGGRRARIA